MQHMRHNWILLLLGCALFSCNPVTVEYTYTPTLPKAGEVVTFTNASEYGEEYEWTFGDNITSTSSNPSHLYKKAGEYVVTVVETKTKKQCSHVVTVVDSVPYFRGDTDIVYYYTPFTFRAELYNPFSHTITYTWDVDTTCTKVVSSSIHEDSIVLYFTRYKVPVELSLIINDNGVNTPIHRQIAITNIPSTALLMRSSSVDYRQRRFDKVFEPEEPTSYAEGKALLDGCQDTMAIYGERTFRLSTLNIPGHTAEGFMLDTVARKIYFRDHGLYVANINLTHIVCLCDEPVSALCVDNAGARIYYATSKGVYYYPLILQSDNRNTYVPVQANGLGDIQRITMDNTPRL